MSFGILARAFNDESGAVTVDWFVVAAAVVSLGIGVAMSLRTGTAALATEISNTLSSVSMATQTSGGAADACDWACAFSGFMMAEEPNFTAAEFGGTLEELAQARLEEFERYDDAMLRSHLSSLDAALSGDALSPVYRTYYAAEATAVQQILNRRQAPT